MKLPISESSKSATVVVSTNVEQSRVVVDHGPAAASTAPRKRPHPSSPATPSLGGGASGHVSEDNWQQFYGAPGAAPTISIPEPRIHLTASRPRRYSSVRVFSDVANISGKKPRKERKKNCAKKYCGSSCCILGKRGEERKRHIQDRYINSAT